MKRDQPSDSSARMLAGREKIIERIIKSAKMHELDNVQMGAICIHATSAALLEVSELTPKAAGEALRTSVPRYIAEFSDVE